MANRNQFLPFFCLPTKTLDQNALTLLSFKHLRLMAGLLTLSAAVQADLHNIWYRPQWGMDHLWIPPGTALIKITRQIVSCLLNRLGVSGCAAQTFSQTLLTGDMF